MGYLPLSFNYSADFSEVHFGLKMPVTCFNTLIIELGMCVMEANYEIVQPFFWGETLERLVHKGLRFSLGLRF